MQNDNDRKATRETEALLRSSLPIGVSDTQLDSIRERVTARRVQPFRLVRVTVAVAAMVTAILVASTSLQSTQAPQAFAAERASQVLFPSDAVLHVETKETTTGRLHEAWIDVDLRESREQWSVETSAGLQVQWLTVIGDGRVRTLMSLPPMDPPFEDEEMGIVIHEEPVHAESVSEHVTWSVQWADMADQLISGGDDSVAETTTPEGEPAWYVAWTEDCIQTAQTYSVVLRKSDYRPTTITYEYVDVESGKRDRSEYAITVWETVAREDVPTGTLDPDTIQDPDAKFVSEIYAADNSRLVAFSEFPAWRLAEEDGLGSISSGTYERGERGGAVMFFHGVQVPIPESPKDLRPFGGLTLYYLNDALPKNNPSEGAIEVTTYNNADGANVDVHWAGRLMDLFSPTETTGELEGRAYRLAVSSTDGRATVLTVIGDQTVVITGPTRDIVLTAFGALERL